MLGAIVGDIVGSSYESFEGNPDYDFPLFKSSDQALTHLEISGMTDDSILTLAVADYLLNRENSEPHEKLKDWYRKYPDAGYGNWFLNWAKSEKTDGYNSYGNGSAMRVSPVSYFTNDISQCYNLAREVTEVTHDHPQGIRGALATSHCIFRSLHGAQKQQLRNDIEEGFGYNLDFDYQKLQEEDPYKPVCQKSVPRAIFCFLNAENFEDTLRKTVCIGGDVDTNCAISCSIAEAFYGGVPKSIRNEAMGYFDDQQLEVFIRFIKSTRNSFNYWK